MISKDFNDLENKIHQAKRKLDNDLKKLLSEAPNFQKETVNIVHTNGVSFFSEFESFIVSISSEYDSLSNTQINDVLTSIENILNFSIEYWDFIKKVSSETLNFELQPSNNFLKTSQIIFKTYQKEKALELKNKFKSYNIPIEGFKSREKYKLKSSKIDKTSLVIGIILLIITTIIIFTNSIETGMQYWFTRILGSLGVALLLTAFYKHSIKAQLNVPTYTIIATGAIVIFFILYFLNPANEPEYNPKSLLKTHKVTLPYPKNS
jgi:uncharacterized integral membrane protein